MKITIVAQLDADITPPIIMDPDAYLEMVKKHVRDHLAEMFVAEITVTLFKQSDRLS